MSDNKKYWKGVEELNDSSSFQAAKNKEFNEYLPAEDFLADGNLLADTSTNRRDFLKYLGFGVTAASLAACETPVNKVIPYVIKTDKTNPGVANYFATTFSDGYDFCDIVVKTREGRPIKIDGNKRSPFTKGAINARVNSSVLSLYDEKRYRAPQISGEEVSWSKFDSAVKTDLDAILAKGGTVRILTNTITSPSTKMLIEEFVKANSSANIKHISYDAISFSGMLEANKEVFGKAVLPSYDLSKAKSIVSIAGDFMNDFPSSIELTAQYAEGRKPENNWMSKHFQFESLMSLTGSNADVRVPIKPSEQGLVAAALLKYVTAKVSGKSVSAKSTAYDEKIKMAGDHLLANKGASIVMAGANDKNVQSIVIAINMALGNYGTTIDMETPNFLKKGMDSEVVA